MFFFLLVLDISIAVVDLLQEMTDVENVSDDDEETDQLFDALVTRYFFTTSIFACI